MPPAWVEMGGDPHMIAASELALTTRARRHRPWLEALGITDRDSGRAQQPLSGHLSLDRPLAGRCTGSILCSSVLITTFISTRVSHVTRNVLFGIPSFKSLRPGFYAFHGDARISTRPRMPGLGLSVTPSLKPIGSTYRRRCSSNFSSSSKWLAVPVPSSLAKE